MENFIVSDAKALAKNWTLSDWSMPKEMFIDICENIEHGSTILELGSGESTKLLSKYYTMISVEDNKDYIGLCPSSQYLYVPKLRLDDKVFPDDVDWFDPDLLERQLSGLEYDCILIDGPSGYRGGFLKYLHLFDNSVPMYFDDVMAEPHMKLMQLVASKLGREDIRVFQCEPNPKAVCWFDGKQYGKI